MPERLTSFSIWCHIHLNHFPFVAVWVDNLANAENSEIMQWIQEHILSGNAASIASMVSNGVMMAVKYVANAFIGLLIMIYLLNYKERLFAITRKMVNATCSQKRKATLYEFAGIVNETFIGFIVGRIIDSFIIGVLTYIVLKICAIPFALMLSVIVGVTNVIPFFGPFIGAIPSVFILLLENPIEALYFVIKCHRTEDRGQRTGYQQLLGTGISTDRRRAVRLPGHGSRCAGVRRNLQIC